MMSCHENHDMPALDDHDYWRQFGLAIAQEAACECIQHDRPDLLITLCEASEQPLRQVLAEAICCMLERQLVADMQSGFLASSLN